MASFQAARTARSVPRRRGVGGSARWRFCAWLAGVHFHRQIIARSFVLLQRRCVEDAGGMTARESFGFTALTQSSQRKTQGTEEAEDSTARSGCARKARLANRVTAEYDGALLGRLWARVEISFCWEACHETKTPSHYRRHRRFAVLDHSGVAVFYQREPIQAHAGNQVGRGDGAQGGDWRYWPRDHFGISHGGGRFGGGRPGVQQFTVFDGEITGRGRGDDAADFLAAVEHQFFHNSGPRDQFAAQRERHLELFDAGRGGTVEDERAGCGACSGGGGWRCGSYAYRTGVQRGQAEDRERENNCGHGGIEGQAERLLERESGGFGSFVHDAISFQADGHGAGQRGLESGRQGGADQSDGYIAHAAERNGKRAASGFGDDWIYRSGVGDCRDRGL